MISRTMKGCMGKVHFKEASNPLAGTRCGRNGNKVSWTPHIYKVTCRNCLRSWLNWLRWEAGLKTDTMAWIEKQLGKADTGL